MHRISVDLTDFLSENKLNMEGHYSLYIAQLCREGIN